MAHTPGRQRVKTREQQAPPAPRTRTQLLGCTHLDRASTTVVEQGERLLELLKLVRAEVSPASAARRTMLSVTPRHSTLCAAARLPAAAPPRPNRPQTLPPSPNYSTRTLADAPSESFPPKTCSRIPCAFLRRSWRRLLLLLLALGVRCYTAGVVGGGTKRWGRQRGGRRSHRCRSCALAPVCETTGICRRSEL